MWAGSAIHGLGLKAADFVRVFAMAKMLGIRRLSWRKVQLLLHSRYCQLIAYPYSDCDKGKQDKDRF
jgi:hypothetical protein